MKTIALALTLLFASCATDEAERVRSPAEQLWIDVYCHGDLIPEEDQVRMDRWIEKHHITCPQKKRL